MSRRDLNGNSMDDRGVPMPAPEAPAYTAPPKFDLAGNPLPASPPSSYQAPIAGGAPPYPVVAQPYVAPPQAMPLPPPLRQHAPRSRRRPVFTAGARVGPSSPAFAALGGFVFVAGAVLWCGNVFQFLPTFPLAGCLVMLVGAGIYSRAT